MRKVIITESSLRGLLREMMDSPVNVNPVVDSQAPEVDPTNPNFVPSNKMELMSALRALVSPVEDDEVPQVYVAIKDAVGEEEIEEKEDDDMKDSRFAEAIIRQTIRNLLNEESPEAKRFGIAQKSGFNVKPGAEKSTASQDKGGFSGKITKVLPPMLSDFAEYLYGDLVTNPDPGMSEDDINLIKDLIKKSSKEIPAKAVLTGGFPGFEKVGARDYEEFKKFWIEKAKKETGVTEATIRQTIRNLLKESLLNEETPAEKRARIAQQSGIKTTKAINPGDIAKSAVEKFVAKGGEIKKGAGPGAEKPVKPIAPSKSEAQEEIEDLKTQLAPVMEIIGSIPEGHFEAFEEAYQAIRVENDSLGPDDVVDSNQFSNIFKKKTGTTFKQFLNELGESLMIALGNLTGEFTTKDIQAALAADGIDVSASMLENKVYQSALAKAVFLKQAQDRGSFPEDIERPSVSDFAEWLYGSIDLDEEPDVTDNDARYMLAVINKPEFKGPARREDIIKVGFESAADDNVWAEFMDWWNSK